MKEKNNKILIILCIVFAVIAICAVIMACCKSKKCITTSGNSYNSAFYELLDNMEDVENYLLKALVTTDSKESTETLTYIWKDANLAQICLSQIPISNDGISNTQKFLNQVSEYSYTLSRKSLKGEKLTTDELSKIKELYNYCIEVNKTLNQIMRELEDGTISWKDLEKNSSSMFEKDNTNNATDSFDSIENNFEEYDGLIYDGAYSEHITNIEKKGLTGENIDEEKAKNIGNDLIGTDNIKNIESKGLSENGTIQSYTFEIETNNNENITIAISQKGGHIVFMNYNRETNEENISIDEADLKATDFLNSNGFKNMKKTYYVKESGVATINYAYEEKDVTIYPDLIKVKVALDNGDILGIETTGYLNNHEDRKINKENIISIQQALKTVNQELNVESTKLAIIPTEYKTEVFCWELQGRVEDKQFLLYVNANTGKVEDVLVIIDTENGVLTQ